MEISKSSFSKWMLAIIYACCLLFLLFQGGKTPFMLFLIMSGLFVYLLLGKWSGIARIQGHRELRLGGDEVHVHALPAGSRMEVRLHMRIPGWWPIPFVLVREALLRNQKSEISFEVSFVPNYKRLGEAVYLTPPLSRGRYEFTPTTCSTSDIFGLFEQSGVVDAHRTFAILPQIVEIRGVQQLMRGAKGLMPNSALNRYAKETTQINGVREYAYGDKLSRIHWNATARTGQLRSKEFERESLPRILVVLDRYKSAYSRADRFELAVSVAASLFEYGAKREVATGFLSVGLRTAGHAPRNSQAHRQQVLNHCVEVEADAELPIPQALRQGSAVLSPGMFAMLVTAQGGDEVLEAMHWLERRGLTPCLIRIADEPREAGQARTGWQQEIAARGWKQCEVRYLQELPLALEGVEG